MLTLLSGFLIACVVMFKLKVKVLLRFALSGVVALQVLLLSSVIGLDTNAQAQTAGPQYPIIFVHGLRSSGATWETMIKGLDNIGYLTAGRLRAADSGPICYWRDDWKDDTDPSAYLGAIPSAIPDYKRYFAIDFTDNDDLSFYEQARQLKVVIDCVKTLTNTIKVSLVGHSMGGLASRFYLQSLAAGATYGSDVQRLITIGTPHNGGNSLADLTFVLDSKHYLWDKFSSKETGLGIAVHSLAFPSKPIDLMNAQTAVAGHQLPPILYASIRYGSAFGLGDGIVSFKSQSLLESLPASVKGSIIPLHTYWDFPTAERSTLCYKEAQAELLLLSFGGTPLYHVCETADPQSIASVAYALSTDVRSVVTEEPYGIGQTGFAAKVSYQATGATSAFTVGFEWGLSPTSFSEHEETTGYGSSYSSDTTRIKNRAPGSTVYFRGYTIVNGIRANGNVRQVTLHVLPVPPQSLLTKPLLSLPASGANGLSERPVFKWSSVVNASSYRVFISKIPIDPLSEICNGCTIDAATVGTVYQPPGNLLVAGQTYYWRVRGKNADRSGELSDIRQFTIAANTLLPSPVPLSPISGSSVNSAAVALTWQAVAGATSYRVLVAKDAASLNIQPYDAACPNCLINATVIDATVQLDGSVLSPGSTYYWRVKARNAAQYGNYSDVQRFTVSQAQCSFAFTQSSLTAYAGGGTYSLPLTAQPGCPSAVSANQSYCTVSSTSVTANSAGQAALNLTVQSNGATARTCAVTVGNALLNVTQPANAPLTTWTFTLNQAAGGTATVSPNQTVFADGATINLSATPASGYTFAGWRESGGLLITGANYAFPIHSNRTLVPVFSSTQVNVTGSVNPVANADQKWRVLGNGLIAMNTWQKNGETISLQSGTTYRVDCADTPYYQPVLNTFSFTAGNSFNCNYTAKAQQAISPSLVLRPQSRLASGRWNSLANIDGGRAVVWGLADFMDFPNYGANTKQFLTSPMKRPLFLPNSTDVAGVNIAHGNNNGLSTLSSAGIWKRWSHSAGTSIRVPTADPVMNGFVKLVGNLGLKGDGSLWFVNESGPSSPLANLSNIVDIAGTMSGSYNPTIALRSDGAVISLTDPSNSSPCNVAGISTNLGSPFSNCVPPVALPGISRVVSIAATNADFNAYAVRDDGTVWVWGSGALTGGAVRDGNNYAPAQIPGISDAVQVVVGAIKGVIYVRTATGQVYAWGANDLGQLGRGTVTASEPSPQVIAGLSNIAELGQTGGYSLVALDTNGFVWTLGVAQTVGNGTPAATQSTPVKVSCPNGYVGDLNITAFDTYCIPAASNVLSITDSSPGLGKQVFVDGMPVALPFSQAFPAGTQVTMQVVPDVGFGLAQYRGDLVDGQSLVRAIAMNRDWNIGVQTYSCANIPGTSRTAVNGTTMIPIEVTSTGGSQTVNVYSTQGPTALTNCHWGFYSADTWIHATADGFGEGAFVLSIEPNPGTTQRLGHFSLSGPSGRTVQVTQAASAVDTSPDAFSFPSYIGAPVSTLIESSAISLSGFNTSAAISIANGEYSIGCNGTFTSAAGTIDNTQTLCVRQTSASAFQTSTTTTVTIGGMVGTFVVTTQADTAVPQVSLSPPSLTFANQIVGSTSASQGVTLTNAGTAVLSIASITSNNNVFGVTHNCGASVAVGANCTLSVTFSPIAAATTTSSVAINTNATGSPHSVGLSGTGIVSNLPVCTLTAAPATVRKNGPSLLTSSCANTPTSYAWTGGTCAGTTAATCAVTPAITTTYGVTATNGSGSGSASATVTVASGDITPILFLLLFD